MAITNNSIGNKNMGNWWERQDKNVQQPKFAYRAVAYYRHSAQDRQENSISIQQDQVRPGQRATAWKSSTNSWIPASPG